MATNASMKCDNLMSKYDTLVFSKIASKYDTLLNVLPNMQGGALVKDDECHCDENQTGRGKSTDDRLCSSQLATAEREIEKLKLTISKQSRYIIEAANKEKGKCDLKCEALINTCKVEKDRLSVDQNKIMSQLKQKLIALKDKNEAERELLIRKLELVNNKYEAKIANLKQRHDAEKDQLYAQMKKIRESFEKQMHDQKIKITTDMMRQNEEILSITKESSGKKHLQIIDELKQRHKHEIESLRADYQKQISDTIQSHKIKYEKELEALRKEIQTAKMPTLSAGRKSCTKCSKQMHGGGSLTGGGRKDRSKSVGNGGSSDAETSSDYCQCGKERTIDGGQSVTPTAVSTPTTVSTPTAVSTPTVVSTDFIKKSQCSQIINNVKEEVTKKYACYDGLKYYRGDCNKIPVAGEYDIKNHPLFSRYISRSEASDIMNRQLRKMQMYYQNMPIDQHKDYSKLKSQFNDTLRNSLMRLKQSMESAPIEVHKDYRNLMNAYACKIGTDHENPKYVPCKSCTSTSTSTSTPATQNNGDLIPRKEAQAICQKYVDRLKQKFRTTTSS